MDTEQFLKCVIEWDGGKDQDSVSTPALKMVLLACWQLRHESPTTLMIAAAIGAGERTVYRQLAHLQNAGVLGWFNKTPVFPLWSTSEDVRLVMTRGEKVRV